MASLKKYVVIQTFVPEFRLPLYIELERRIGSSFAVLSGADYFTPTGTREVGIYSWSMRLTNCYFLGRRVLFQKGAVVPGVRASICVLEFNPRVVSSWVILLVRCLLRRETVLWGHLLTRAGVAANTAVIRALMLRIAGRVNLYTYSEQVLARKLFPGVKCNVSPNAVMWRNECKVSTVRSYSLTSIVFVSRLFDEKKPMLLIKAFFEALPRLPHSVHLQVVGDGPQRPALERFICDNGLNQRVSIYGSNHNVDFLREIYASAIVAVSPGYVGLSATQAFGFGVPMLIARDERHSVEIEQCQEGFNCSFFPSNSVQALATAIVDFVNQPPVWSRERGEIMSRVSSRYVYESMCDGFERVFRQVPTDSIFHVGVAWMGLPYYAARVLREARERHPEWRFTVISSSDGVPYKDVQETVGVQVHWIDSTRDCSWGDLGVPPPDLFLMTSWPHRAYRALAREAVRVRGAYIVSMVDNYLRYTLKQFIGWLYFRFSLRDLFSAVWVPGRRSRLFLRFLGMPEAEIFEGLYTADPGVFFPPEDLVERSGIVFVGQLIERKGILELAAVYREMNRLRLLFVLTVVGQGPMKSLLESIGLNVKPFAQAGVLADYYRKSSALILPSKIDHWGVVVHEAALCGCLLLVTRQCGCAPELVEHRKNGFIMDSCSEESISEAIEWFNGLTVQQIKLGRAESIRRAATISPTRWADTLDDIVTKSRSDSPILI